jgi:hypothetical protein
VWFPVTLSTDEGPVGAICRDASAAGMQVSCRSPIAVGSNLQATFSITLAQGTSHVVNAHVVRSETNEGDLSLAFPFRLALRFLKPLPDLPQLLADQLGTEVSP